MCSANETEDSEEAPLLLAVCRNAANEKGKGGAGFTALMHKRFLLVASKQKAL